MTADEDDDSPEAASPTADDEDDGSSGPEPTLSTVLITGCSSGIGRATAKAFRSEGWLVYATARDEDDLADLADIGCETAELDVTDRGQVERVVDRVVDEAGHIDCVVNNAGYAQLGPIEDVPTDKVHEQFDVNVYGPHRLVRAVAPHMREAEDGTFVNVSSVSGKLSVAGTGVYSASKFAVEAMSDALRSELREFDVEVVVVEPGPVATEFGDRAESEVDDLPRSEAYDDLYEIFEDASLVAGDGPLAVSPNEVAAVILNAASSTDPATRYPVGVVAKYGLLARYLPDRIRDVVVGLVRRFAT